MTDEGNIDQSSGVTPDNDPLTLCITLQNKRGLHARASAKFVATASQWDAKIVVMKDGYFAGGGSIMGLLTLGAGIGSEIEIKASGPQAKEALEALKILIDERFGEDQ